MQITNFIRINREKKLISLIAIIKKLICSTSSDQLAVAEYIINYAY